MDVDVLTTAVIARSREVVARFATDPDLMTLKSVLESSR
jgi:hypothetical protein